MYREQYYEHEDLQHLKRNPGVMHIIPALIAGGAILASTLAKKKSANFDPSAIEANINQAGQEQRATLAQIRPETNALLEKFQGNQQGAQDKASAAREAERTRYLQELDPVSSRLLQAQTDQLKRTTFGAIPEAQQATREALAASGGLNRGVSAESLAKVPLQAAQTFSEGAANLQQASLAEKQKALGNLHTEESQAIAQNLGIDQDTYNTILNTGDAALMAELNGLIEESKRRNEGIQNAEIARQTGNIAASSAENANQQAIYQALGNLGGTFAGYGTPSGVESGVEAVPTIQSKKRAIKSASSTVQTA